MFSQDASTLYQSIDLNTAVPCNCSDKTARTDELAKAVVASDITDFRMIAYKIRFDENTVVNVAKLFRAFEQDVQVHKVSVKEWDYMLLFVRPGFDKVNFDIVAKKIFTEFSETTPEDFFLHKNTQLLNLYKSVTPGQSSPSSN